MTLALISIGSNRNGPQAQIAHAIELIDEEFSDIRRSALYRTEPVGVVQQDSFINAAILLETQFQPLELLKWLLHIENLAGRDRALELPKGPRNLDLDLILFGGIRLHSPELELPHPRFRQRRFVLQPAAEIAGEMIDPVSGKTIEALLNECQDTSWVHVLSMERATA